MVFRSRIRGAKVQGQARQTEPMRTLLVTLLLASLGLAGCLSNDVDTDSSPQSTETLDPATSESIQYDDPDFDWEGLDRSYPYHVLEEFCTSPEMCDYWDGQFHEGAVYEMDTMVIDAVVLPAPGIGTTQATVAAGQATANWALVEEFTNPWFTDAWELNTYVVGSDVPSIDAVTDPEVIVVTEGFQRSTSIGLNAEQLACEIAGILTGDYDATGYEPGSLATRVYDVHEHHGMEIYAADCVSGGFRCVALNFAGTALTGNNPLYDLVAHEVGHCIGLSHVGDALDFNSRFVPTLDIMAYADNYGRVSCPSTLNARALEGIYAHLVDGQSTPEWLASGERYAMNPWEYVVTECDTPPAGFLG